MGFSMLLAQSSTQAQVLEAVGALREWRLHEVVGPLVEVGRLALNNLDGLTQEEIDRLEGWKESWQALDKRLQRVLADNMDEVSGIGFMILDNQPLLEHHIYKIKRIWIETYGYEMTVEIE